MHRNRCKLFIAAMAVTALATLSPPAHAGLYDWNQGTVITVADPDTTASASTNITSISYAAKDGYHYFKMDLEAAPDTSTVYGIYLSTPKPEGPVEPKSLLGIQYVSENQLVSTARGKFSLLTHSFIVESEATLNDVTSALNGKSLEWKIAASEVGSSFWWLGATLTSDLNVLDRTNMAATPIPAAAWLFGSGIVGLVGIKRKKQKKLTGSMA